MWRGFRGEVMDAVGTKICCVCKKDVSSAKRVKDAAGHYYCAPCHTALAQRAAAAKGQARPPPVGGEEGWVDRAARPVPPPPPAPNPAAPPADDGMIDLAEPEPARAPKAAPRPVAAASGAAPAAV